MPYIIAEAVSLTSIFAKRIMKAHLAEEKRLEEEEESSLRL